MKTVTIKLGERSYKVPHLNLGQVDDIDELMANGELKRLKRSYAVLAVVLQRADPKVEDVRSLEASPEEVNAAIKTALEFSGIKPAEGSDPNSSAPAPGAG
jgi:hypothetical protein